MYEIHLTEWGPARHHTEHPSSQEALQAFMDLRDAEYQRPDDN